MAKEKKRKGRKTINSEESREVSPAVTCKKGNYMKKRRCDMCNRLKMRKEKLYAKEMRKTKL